ncbi:hypothetical protein Clacol_005284 [Clathrus columnatus]|uniref:Cytochrome P450 n=1 Tax=Clathrus columnatus TaxID=1419009 RepID=A0AAV5AEG0_9AGAM|nr:hypothetical protein Clacol_005284 [Clathrus columnatus]
MGALILEVTYGIQALSEKDPMLVLADDTTQKIGQAGIPGTYLVDIFPRNGNAKPSVASALIEQLENNPNRPTDYKDVIKHVTGVAYITAIDTSNGVLFHFFYTMLLYPEIQKRAQQELDQIIGPDTLPSFEDFERLKYIKAIIYELLRWNTVLASGIPHVLAVDDVIDGYFIPKGTIVFGNTWTLLRSKSTYGSDADQFKPERFLDEKLPLPDFAFGYGRRMPWSTFR